MPRFSINHVNETFQCSECGSDIAVATEIRLDDEEFLTFQSHAQCGGDEKWHRADLLHAILIKLGYSFE